MKKHLGTITIGLFIVTTLVLYWISFTVRMKETAIVTNFGKISKVQDQAGHNFIMPWNKVIKFDTRIRTLEKEPTEVSTRDKQNVILMPYVNWYISDVEAFYTSFRKTGVNDAESIVFEGERRLKNFMAEACNVLVGYDLSELITLDAKRFKLPEIEKGKDGMFSRIQEQLLVGGGCGIAITDVGIRKLNIPETVTTSVFDRMGADRMKEASRLLSDGKSKAQAIQGVASAKREEIIAQAQSEAEVIKGEGDADAAKSYTQFQKHRELWELLTKIDTLKTTLQDGTTIILDSESSPFEMLMQVPKANNAKGGN